MVAEVQTLHRIEAQFVDLDAGHEGFLADGFEVA